MIFLLFLPWILSWPFHDSGSSLSRITHTNGQIYDELGRSRLFHGVNIVYKTFPYVPDLDSFDPRFSFSQKDVDLLADLGMNVIRLDVSWAGAEPIRGSYNQSYFNQLHRIIDMCAKKGIYVILEWHQDLFSEKYCGNGAPLWASRPHDNGTFLGFRYPFSFSADELDPQTGSPTKAACDRAVHVWALRYLSHSVSQAFEDLYQNYNGVRDSFVAFWKKIASEFKDKKNLLGYELINGAYFNFFFSDASRTLVRSNIP